MPVDSQARVHTNNTRFHIMMSLHNPTRKSATYKRDSQRFDSRAILFESQLLV